MVKITNIFGDTYSGQAGKAGVFANWKGRQYRRKYVIPSNPNTVMQQAVRGSFEDAVNLWHTFLSLQRSAYGYMATGLVMSGFNLLVSRWQKLTPAQRADYVNPHMGMKQVGSSDLTTIADIPTVLNQEEYSTAEVPLGLGQTTFAPGTSGIDCHAIIDLNRGRINITKTVAGAFTIDYESEGRVITGEEVDTDLVNGEVFYTKYWPVKYKSVEFKLDAAAVDGLEVDILLGKFRFTKTLPTSVNGTIDSKKYTPLQNAKLETTKVDTSFITWRGYTSALGILSSAQTNEDGNRDFRLDLTGYAAEIRANISPQDAAKDEYIKLIAS